MFSTRLRAYLTLIAAAAGAGLLVCATLRAGETPPAEPLPVSPFAPNTQSPPREDARPGAVTLSNGETVHGMVMLTRDARLDLYEDAHKIWRQLAVEELARIDVAVEQEKEEKEWRWKEGGSDVKVYTGRTYVDRKYLTTVTLADGRTRFAGHVRGTVFYVQPAGGERRRFFLRHDEAGGFDQKSADLVYVRSVVLDAAGPEPPAPGQQATPKKTP